MFYGSSPVLRPGLTAAVAAGLLLSGAGTAAAHVTVSAPDAAAGHSTVATFSVPTESDTADTTAVRITVPQLATARTEPVPGWTAQIDRDDEDRVVAVSWTADPGRPGIRPGEFQRFVVSMGPLPESDSLTFPAEQSYSDGTVVRWDQVGDHDSVERPAPALEVDEDNGDGSGHDHGDSATAASDSDDAADTTARWLGGLGLAGAALALGAAVGAILRGRR